MGCKTNSAHLLPPNRLHCQIEDLGIPWLLSWINSGNMMAVAHQNGSAIRTNGRIVRLWHWLRILLLPCTLHLYIRQPTTPSSTPLMLHQSLPSHSHLIPQPDPLMPTLPSIQPPATYPEHPIHPSTLASQAPVVR